jgi:4'-phosphopantetheinyl transferase EntD
MPLVYQQNINAVTKIGVWHIAEGEDFFLQRVPLQKEITHPHKRLQHLAGRMILQELYDDFPISLILIADTKKPFLTDEAYHFSISHCNDYAAAIVSRQNRVGVDIEIPHEKIERIQFKYLNTGEIDLLASLHYSFMQSLTLGWSIKETVFKWYGNGKVDFKEHIHVNGCIARENQFIATCSFLKDTSVSLKVHGIFFNGNCLTWLIT